MPSSFTGGVRAVEAILTKKVAAVLALDHRRLLLALLAHHHGVGLPNHVNFNLLLPDLAQKIERLLQVVQDRAQVELLLHVGLGRE